MTPKTRRVMRRICEAVFDAQAAEIVAEYLEKSALKSQEKQ